MSRLATLYQPTNMLLQPGQGQERDFEGVGGGREPERLTDTIFLSEKGAVTRREGGGGEARVRTGLKLENARKRSAIPAGREEEYGTCRDLAPKVVCGTLSSCDCGGLMTR